MNEIRQLCTTSLSPTEHLDEILALFHACPPQHLLPSLSLIGQSISCTPIERLNLDIVNHQLFLVIRQWAERLLQLWLVNGTMNGEEHRALFYTHQLFKLLCEWLAYQDHLLDEHDSREMFTRVLTHLFVERGFLNTLCRVIYQLISSGSGHQHTVLKRQLSDQVSPDDIQLQTSEDQANAEDVLDALYRCVNSLITIFSHPTLLSNTIAHETLTVCLLACLQFPLFIQLSTDFLRQTSSTEAVPIQSIFLLFTSLDYCAASLTTSTLDLLPSIRKVLHVWCEIPHNAVDDVSPLIVRFIRLINRLALSHREAIIDANICGFFIPHFETLCQTPEVTDDIVSLLLTLSTTVDGKRHLRRLGYIQHLLRVIRRRNHLWHPLSLLITPRDFYQASFFKKLIQLLVQRTGKILQLLGKTFDETSVDSTASSSRDQIYVAALDWFTLLRLNFLSFTMLVDELISCTKNGNLIHMIIDTILSLAQDEDGSLTLVEVMIDLLWTLSFSTSTNIHEILQKRLDLCRWLTTNLNASTPSIHLASQAILFLLDTGNQSLSTVYLLLPTPRTLNDRLDRTISSPHASPTPHSLICMFYSDESDYDQCASFRDRLQNELDNSIELILTASCESLDSLMRLLDQSTVCIFCATTRMKTDNLGHFVHQYICFQPDAIPVLSIPIEHQCELEGSWLESIVVVNTHSTIKEIRRYLNHHETPPARSLSRIDEHVALDQSNDTLNHSSHYLTCPVLDWTSDDVSEWCNSSRGNFDTLKPLVMRLNGSALINLAEILAMEPASMYYSLNDELRQRTGASAPITEYVSLQSELQDLCKQQRLHDATASASDSSKAEIDQSKERKRSRLCTIL